MKQILAVILVVMLSVSMLAGCSGANHSDSGSTADNVDEVDKSPEEEEKAAPEDSQRDGDYSSLANITVTYVSSPLNVPSIVEKEQGLFASAFSSYGLGVEYSNLTTGPEQTQALASGDIQFLNAVGATSVILSSSNGLDIRIISMYSRSPEAFRLFTGDESITAAADLAGKRVAGPKGTILHELLIAYLATAGLTEEDIEFYAMDIPSSQAALASGEVDCALLAGAAAYNMEQDGYAVVTTGEGLVDATIVTATTAQFYEDYPELVHAFLEAQRQAVEFADGNYEDAMAATAAETGLDAEAVKAMYTMYDFSPDITASDIDGMKRTEEFMRDNHMIENPVDIESLLLNIQ